MMNVARCIEQKTNKNNKTYNQLQYVPLGLPKEEPDRKFLEIFNRDKQVNCCKTLIKTCD